MFSKVRDKEVLNRNRKLCKRKNVFYKNELVYIDYIYTYYFINKVYF